MRASSDVSVQTQAQRGGAWVPWAGYAAKEQRGCAGVAGLAAAQACVCVFVLVLHVHAQVHVPLCTCLHACMGVGVMQAHSWLLGPRAHMGAACTWGLLAGSVWSEGT